MNQPSEFLKAIKSIEIKNLTENEKQILLRIFMMTDDPGLRNNMALVFADLGYDAAVPFLIKKVYEKDLYNKNGTLIFALDSLDSKMYFLDFVKFVCTMAYEARMTAYYIIEKFAGSISQEIREEAMNILKEHRVKQGNVAEEEYENSTLHFIDATERLLKTD